MLEALVFFGPILFIPYATYNESGIFAYIQPLAVIVILAALFLWVRLRWKRPIQVLLLLLCYMSYMVFTNLLYVHFSVLERANYRILSPMDDYLTLLKSWKLPDACISRFEIDINADFIPEQFMSEPYTCDEGYNRWFVYLSQGNGFKRSKVYISANEMLYGGFVDEYAADALVAYMEWEGGGRIVGYNIVSKKTYSGLFGSVYALDLVEITGQPIVITNDVVQKYFSPDKLLPIIHAKFNDGDITNLGVIPFFHQP